MENSYKERIKFIDEIESNFIQDYKSGISIKNIINKYNISYYYINKALKKYKLIKEKYIYNENFLDVLDDNAAYYVGLFLADGCIRKSTKNTYSSILTLKKTDEELLKYLGKLLFIGNRMRLHSYSRVDKRTNKTYSRTDLIINNIKLNNKLIYFGFEERKSLTVKFNKHLEQELDLNNTFNSFLRGCFDGDGHFSFKEKNGKITFSQWRLCGSDNFILDMYNKIKKELNISCSIFKEKKISTLIICKKYYIYKIFSYIYNNSNIENRLDRKYQKYLLFNNIYLNELNGNTKINQSKLTPNQVLEIRKIYSNKTTSFKELCKIYKIGRSAMRRIINRESWKNI